MDIKNSIPELKVGMTFTGSEDCFTGRVTITWIDKEANELRVNLTKETCSDGKIRYSHWTETWDYKATVHGFENGYYFEKNFPEYEKYN